jgi:pimeloyl-ACP methyl ester carboxylesterase
VKLLTILLLSAAAALAPASRTAPLPPGLHIGITFQEASPLASTVEILRRTFTPLKAAHIEATKSTAGQPIDIAQEKFLVYVPPHRPPQGYALLVFVPPVDINQLPPGWTSVLDEKGIIFARAEHSGNDATVQGRRMPLAVTAAERLKQQYGIDPSRVLVAGFSGGSRVALWLALAWPDVFRGALLNSGSDPIGTAAVPLPPADLLHRFQENSRLYFITGILDPVARSMQGGSETSLQSWCVFDIHAAVMPHAGHTAADEQTLSRALDTLLDPAPTSHEDLAACRARLQGELAAQVQRIEALIAGGDKAAAREALNDLDSKFGGLAAAEILALNKKLQ